VPKIIIFLDAFMCYKQKCKVVSLNLAHPVYRLPYSVATVAPEMTELRVQINIWWQ